MFGGLSTPCSSGCSAGLNHFMSEHFPEISVEPVKLVLGIQATEDDVSIYDADFNKVVEHFFPPFLTSPLDRVAAKELIKIINSYHKLSMFIYGNGLQ